MPLNSLLSSRDAAAVVAFELLQLLRRVSAALLIGVEN